MLYIEYQPSLFCNYRCPYCIQQGCNTNFTNQKKVYMMADLIASKIKDNLNLGLIGGEVTVYNVERIIKNFKTLKKLTIITNLSASIDKLLSLSNYCNENKIILKIVASYQYVDKDIFLDKIKKLKKNGVKISCSIVVWYENINNIDPFEAFYFFKQKHINVKLIHARNLDKTFCDIGEEKKQKILKLNKKENIFSKYIKKNKKYINNFGKICVPKITIDSSGNVKYGLCNQEKTTIFKVKELKMKKIKCTQNKCPGCNIIKLSNGSKYELLLSWCNKLFRK